MESERDTYAFHVHEEIEEILLTPFEELHMELGDSEELQITQDMEVVYHLLCPDDEFWNPLDPGVSENLIRRFNTR